MRDSASSWRRIKAASRADDEAYREHEIKAVFLFNFLQFVEWPDGSFAEPTAPIRICVVGDARLADALRAVADGVQVEGRAVVVDQAASLADVPAVHLLYCSAGAMPEGRAFLQPSARRGVLIVGERADAFARGAAIRLLTEKGRMRFEICPDAASARGVQLRARLLRLARIVECGQE